MLLFIFRVKVLITIIILVISLNEILVSNNVLICEFAKSVAIFSLLGLVKVLSESNLETTRNTHNQLNSEFEYKQKTNILVDG